MTVKATVICDASYCPNTRAGGWATWININWPNGEHQRIQKHGRFKDLPRSSEHAEQMACLNGIWLAYHHGARDLLVQTDCLRIVESYGGPPPKMSAEYSQARRLYWPDASLRWKHVKGHTGGKCPKGGDSRRFYVNEWCDKHAKQHMKKQRKELQEV